MPVDFPWGEIGAAVAAFIVGFSAYLGGQAMQRRRYGDPVDQAVDRAIGRFETEAVRELHGTLESMRTQIWQDFQRMMEQTEQRNARDREALWTAVDHIRVDLHNVRERVTGIEVLTGQYPNRGNSGPT